MKFSEWSSNGPLQLCDWSSHRDVRWCVHCSKLQGSSVKWPFNHAGENQGVCRAEQEEERRLTNCLHSFISDFRDKTLSE